MKTENIQAILPGTKFQKSTVANPAVFEQLLVQILNGEASDYSHQGEAEINFTNQDLTQEDDKLMKKLQHTILSSSLPNTQEKAPTEDELKSENCQEDTLHFPFYMGLSNTPSYDKNANELNIIKPQDCIISSLEALDLTNNVNEHSDKQTENTPINYLPHLQTQKDENGQEYNPIARETKVSVPSEQNNNPLNDVKANPINNAPIEVFEGVSLGKNQELPQTIFAPEKMPNETKEQSRESINPVHYNDPDSTKKDIHQVASAIPENVQKTSDEEAQEFLPMKFAFQSTVIEAKRQAEKNSELINYDIQQDDSQREQQVVLPYHTSTSKQVPITLDTHNVDGSAETNNEDAVKIDGNETNTKSQDNPVRDSVLETDEVKQSSLVNPFTKELEITSNELMMKSLEDQYSNKNLQKVNDSIIQLIETTSDGDTSIMKVKLYPKELGTVNVILHLEEGKVIAKILVDNESIKQLFQGKINELNHSLNKQNVQLDEIHIDLNDQGNGSAHRDSNPHQNKNHYVKRKYDLKTVAPEISYGKTKPLGSRQISILA